MAMLDARLFSLLETLSAAGLDWLAREVLAGSLEGRVPLEPSEALLLVREAVIRPGQDEWKAGVPQWEEVLPTPFSGDEQVVWAAAHVVARLTDVIAMMEASMEAIDTVVEKADTVGHRYKSDTSTSLVLADGEEKMVTTRGDLAGATAGVDLLRKALATWVGGGQLA